MRWSEEQAIAWRRSQPWRCGFNYVTSSAVNSTEMWLAASFDATTIARELAWAGRLGFNGCRVFLQYLVWDAEPVTLLDRFERFLDLAAANGLGVMPVLFDDCAFSGQQPYLGPQAPPVAGVHNSGWTPSPGHQRVTDQAGWPRLEGYATAFVGRFGNDPRVTVWDLYNEPGNSDLGNRSLPLLRALFGWARGAAPAQPLTAGVWNAALGDLNEASIELSDVVSFHCYLDLAGLARGVQDLRTKAGPRPLLCTEWMARKFGSRFGTHLPYFCRDGIDAYSWGLVKGKTQTHLPWGSPPGAAEPEEWFHEVLHPDGTPYREEEAAALRRHTGRAGRV
jgi:hypothetical protein